MSLTGLEKAALLLNGLGPDATEAILAQLGAGAAERVRAQMRQLEARPDLQEALGEVLRETAQALPQDTAPTTPASATKPEPVARPTRVNLVIREGTGSDDEDVEEEELPSDALEAIAVLAPPTLVFALQGESPRTVALILNLLDTARAGEVYKRLAPELRRDASLHFASQPLPPVELLRRVAQGIVQKCRALRQGSPAGDQGDRVKKMIELLRLLDRAERTTVLAALTERDPTTAQKVRDALYVFEDLAQVEGASVQKLLAELDTKTLALALKGATPAVQHKVLTNLSRRAQDALNEEIDLMGTVPKAKIEQARKSIADVIRRLDERGDLVMTE